MWRIIVAVIVIDILLLAAWQVAFTEVDQVHISRLVRTYYDTPTPQNKIQMDTAMNSAFGREFYGAITCIGLAFAFTLGGGVLIYREWRARHLTSR